MAQQSQQLPNNQDAVFAECQSQTHLLIEIRDQLKTVNEQGVLTKPSPPSVSTEEARKLQEKLREIADALRPVPLGI